MAYILGHVTMDKAKKVMTKFCKEECENRGTCAGDRERCIAEEARLLAEHITIRIADDPDRVLQGFSEAAVFPDEQALADLVVKTVRYNRRHYGTETAKKCARYAAEAASLLVDYFDACIEDDEDDDDLLPFELTEIENATR